MYPLYIGHNLQLHTNTITLLYPLIVPRWYVDDGCNNECEIIINGQSMCADGISDDLVGSYQSNSFQAGVRCCDGNTCRTEGNCPGVATHSEAVDICSEIGEEWRLCTKDELLSEMCCRTGGNCDSSAVWTSTLEQGTVPFKKFYRQIFTFAISYLFDWCV